MRKILIIGSGGREHAIGWKISQSSQETELFFAPGNAGTQTIGTNIELNSTLEILEFAKKEKMDLTIVGSEELLVDGIVDLFQENNLTIFGPDKISAQLEGSKVFAKQFMEKYNVKTAKYKKFTNSIPAKEYLKEQEFPIVVKASGLAAGKGVIICNDLYDAEKTVDEIMIDKKFGDAGNEVVIEEYLTGFEASVLSIFNGKEIIPFISAKDHKKIGEGETGLNTGGMGVIAPNPFYTKEHENQFQEDILKPTLNGLIQEKLLFKGVIFFGLMINEKGMYLLEYNLRMGDPETQAVLPLLEDDLLEIIDKSLAGESYSLSWKNKHSVCVVMASGGYPLNYDKGFEITGLERVQSNYFIAGAKRKQDSIVTSGGRVLNVVGIGNSIDEARKNAYDDISKIHFDYEYYRTDIGKIN
ncbi:MAG: phosphoribosylamine--glycine ligase [Flavobacteriales bacterium]|nr:phosphoribosylamine--glycine ligase [Flavobacteriales bacterium]